MGGYMKRILTVLGVLMIGSALFAMGANEQSS